MNKFTYKYENALPEFIPSVRLLRILRENVKHLRNRFQGSDGN